MFGLRFLSALGIMKLKEKRMFSCILKKFGENMISYIKGTLERRGENDIIVEAGGIGYRIFVSREGGWYEPVRLCGERGAGDV